MQRSISSLLVLAVTAGAAAGGDPNTDQQIAELTDLVGELRAEVQELRQSQAGDDWLTEQRASEVRDLVEDVLADADTRASLLQGNKSGYDGGFRLGGEGFSMQINGQLQIRYVLNRLDTLPGSAVDSTQSGFEARRTKLKFKGHVIDETWKYQVNGTFEDTFGTDGQFELEEAVITKDFGDWSIRVGQFKAPFMHEELVSSTRQLAVDRSLVNERFNADRSAGVELGYENDQWRFAFMVNDGMQDIANGRPGGRNTSAIGNAAARSSEFAIVGRAEYKPFGEWKQFKDFSSKRGNDDGLLLGIAGLFQKGEYGTPGDNEPQDVRLTADVSYESDGWNLFAAFVWQNYQTDADVNQGFMADNQDNWGLVVQGGFFVSDDTEVFVRYEFSDDDQTVMPPPDVEDLSIITAGFNKYFNKYVKWTTDFGYGLNPVNGSNAGNALTRFGAASVGWRRDEPGQDGQFVLRSQLQLVF